MNPTPAQFLTKLQNWNSSYDEVKRKMRIVETYLHQANARAIRRTIGGAGSVTLTQADVDAIYAELGPLWGPAKDNVETAWGVFDAI